MLNLPFSDDGSNPEPDPDYTEYMTGKKNVLGNETMPGKYGSYNNSL